MKTLFKLCFLILFEETQKISANLPVSAVVKQKKEEISMMILDVGRVNQASGRDQSLLTATMRCEPTWRGKKRSFSTPTSFPIVSTLNKVYSYSWLL